ncbi:MAG: hypothetical protein JRJ86_08440 [Deltaproteobacteria bacterium]|nr:hypothetical protein [Deltaproteobacteria bacterium]MBW2118887.1 hypothetical protein [Deltaproteobacteria bacterium]
MNSSEKSTKDRDLDLEKDLLLSKKDFAFMKQINSQDARDLEAYFDFLDDIGAFESKKIKTKFYDAVFEL